MSNLIAEFKILDGGVLPTRATSGSAGYDVYAYEDVTIEPNTLGKIRTGVFAKCPSGTYIRIAPRSGLAYKNQLDVFAGVVDMDYRDEIAVLIFNHSKQTVKLSKGDRVAQFIFEMIYHPEIRLVDELGDTDRKGGFGSTGK
jgi:dUTP pyrophosphatase